MSACNAEWNEKLSAFFDGEATPAEATEVTQHVRTCVRCAEASAFFDELRTSLRAAPVPTLSPDRVRARLHATQRPRLVRWMVVAAVLVLVSLGALLMRRTTPERAFLVEVEGQHLKGFAHGRPCEFESSDSKAVESWVATHVSQSVSVPQLPEATLLGARRCNLGGHATVALVYQVEGKGLTVFVPPEGSAAAASALAFADGGSRCTTGTMGERICATSRTTHAAVAVGNDERTVLLASTAVVGR